MKTTDFIIVIFMILASGYIGYTADNIFEIFIMPLASSIGYMSARILNLLEEL